MPKIKRTKDKKRSHLRFLSACFTIKPEKSVCLSVILQVVAQKLVIVVVAVRVAYKVIF